MELLPLLCALGVCCSLVFGNDVKAFAPEDLDGSGDDEDFSGSGIEGFLDFDTQDMNIFSTSVSLLEPTVTQMPTALQPDVAVEEESEMEHTTTHMETTKPHSIIEDLFAVKQSGEEDTPVKPTTQQPFFEGTTLKPTIQQSFTEESEDDGEKKPHHHHPLFHPHHHTTIPDTSSSQDSFAVDPVAVEPSAEEDTTLRPTSQQASTVESVDLEKHHHHHHHHPHHHTTTTPADLDLDEGTTASSEVENPFVVPEEPITSTPDEETEADDVAQKVTPTTKDLAHHDHHQEAASGSSSTPYADEETTTLQPDINEYPLFVDSEEKTTVADETTTLQDHHHPHHHHHHHHSHHTTTKTPLNGSDVLEETADDEVKPIADHDQHEKTTKTPAEDHHDHHHPHHRTTTASATPSTASENDFIVHTHEPKGRRVNVPLAETTATVPVNKDERIPESMEPVDSSEGPSGDAEVEDFFIESTVQVIEKDRMEPVPADGSSDASHGIMDRKEILAGIIAGGVAGLAFAAALVAFVFYRMKKKDEGSYSLEEPKQSNGGYQKPREQREFYA